MTARETIYNEGLWQIIRQPAGVTDSMVVRFRKVNYDRTLLDLCARWTPFGWDPGRWVPKPPTVPMAIIEKVAAHMCEVAP